MEQSISTIRSRLYGVEYFCYSDQVIPSRTFLLFRVDDTQQKISVIPLRVGYILIRTFVSCYFEQVILSSQNISAIPSWLQRVFILSRNFLVFCSLNQLPKVLHAKPNKIQKQLSGGVFRNFAKFTGKHLCQSLFFIKVAGLRPVTILKKRLWHRCFLVNFANILRTLIFIEHLRWLLLKI